MSRWRRCGRSQRALQSGAERRRPAASHTAVGAAADSDSLLVMAAGTRLELSSRSLSGVMQT